MTLCPPCQASRDRWLDHTGPLELGIKIAQSGPDHATVPRATRRAQIVRSQLAGITTHCHTYHQENR